MAVKKKDEKSKGKTEKQDSFKREKKDEMKINFSEIEKKWQKKWEEAKAFEVSETSAKKKYYVLEMYPYPSASFLHMGHVRNYTMGDIYARFKRMQGFNVLYPMGYDSFGLPAENAAKKEGIHPQKYTEDAIKQIMKYQKALGNSYAWGRMISSHYPDYYKWNQYFFLKMLEKGLAYRKEAPVNWCEKCQSVLANEEAEGGKCWRCGNEVAQKNMKQWFLKITAYADKLLEGLGKLEWPERIKTMQENWIGKSEGTEIVFEIDQKMPKKIQVEDVKHFRDKISINSKLIIKNKEFGIKEIVKFRFDDGSYYMKLFLDNGYVLADDLGGNSFILVKERCTKLDIKEKDIFYDGKKFNFVYNAHAEAEETYGEQIFSKGESESFWDYTSKDGSYLSLGIIDKTKKRLDFYGEIIYSRDLQIINESEKWAIFTTRPDTLMGVTFMVISAQHPRVMEIVSNEQKKEVEMFVKKCIRAKSAEEIAGLEKDGVFTGSYAIHPLTKEKIPVWAGNFVIADYGSGMVMAVPAHDERDFEFAQKYKIPIKVVIRPEFEDVEGVVMDEAYTGAGKLINSGAFNDLFSEEAKGHITNALAEKKLGRKTINYKIRDWMISRQRYWGTPIPVVYCNKCGIVGVPEKELPVLLPEKVDFKAGVTNPLLTNKDFINTKCPKCKGDAKRETDTMGGFVDSSWYFLRFCDNKNKEKPFDKKKVSYWMPVNQYIGGAEHAVMHLIYARFFTRVLKDFGFIGIDEPFKRLFNQGIVYKNGAKMSKSSGNVVFQTDVSNKYGIDTARLFLMFVASPEKDMEWDDNGVEGAYRIINKFARISEKLNNNSEGAEEHKINSAIKKITADIETIDYSKAVVQLFELINYFSERGVSRESYEKLIKMFSVFCPHIAEEMWEKIGNKGFVSLAEWPIFDEKKIDAKFDEAEKAGEKTIADILNVLKIVKERTGKEASKIYLYAIPKELNDYNADEISKRVAKEVFVYAVNDSKKHDPEGKAGKAKPGKPGIFVE